MASAGLQNCLEMLIYKQKKQISKQTIYKHDVLLLYLLYDIMLCSYCFIYIYHIS